MGKGRSAHAHPVCKMGFSAFSELNSEADPGSSEGSSRSFHTLIFYLFRLYFYFDIFFFYIRFFLFPFLKSYLLIYFFSFEKKRGAETF